jgi:hypothetical protein
MNVGTLAKVARTYESRYFFRAVDYAQDQLMGRTHYVDPQTLRYHHARVISARPLFDGALFCIIESAAKDDENTERGFRPVVFDVFGSVVFHPNLDEMTTTSAKAEKMLRDWLESFDLAAYYREAIKKEQRETERHAAQLIEALAA